MSQKENELSWFELFKKKRNLIFTKKDFQKYKQIVEHYVNLYQKYSKKDAKILEIGCGLGCTAIPLSTLGYNVTAIDNNKNIIEYAKINAKNFGDKIEILFADIFDIDKIFKKNVFDISISGGVLEHFSEEQIKKIVEKQLYVAKIVIAGMPITLEEDIEKEYKDFKKKIYKDGIYRNLWTPDYWVDNILKEFNILEYNTGKSYKNNFNEIRIVIGKKKK